MEHKFQKQLEDIEKHILEQTVMKKDFLTVSDAALYAGVSKSYLYKLTSGRAIPFYRPASKLIFFKRTELNDWILNNRCATIQEKAELIQVKKKGGHHD